MKMTSVPQIVPITDLRYRSKDIIEMAQQSPVVITHRSSPCLVVYDYEVYRQQVIHMIELERRVTELERVPALAT